MKRLWTLAITISGALVSNSALPAGSVEAGVTKAVVCQACHGANGNSTNPDWPSLAGIGADYIAEAVEELQGWQTQQSGHVAIVANLSPEDMADLGAYFDSLTNTGLEADPSYWQAAKSSIEPATRHGRFPACMACHGPTGRGNEPAKFPALRGQQSVYVSKQLNDYASGTRSTGPNGIMQTIAKRLTSEDIRNLASYMQGIR